MFQQCSKFWSSSDLSELLSAIIGLQELLQVWELIVKLEKQKHPLAPLTKVSFISIQTNNWQLFSQYR